MICLLPKTVRIVINSSPLAVAIVPKMETELMHHCILATYSHVRDAWVSRLHAAVSNCSRVKVCAFRDSSALSSQQLSLACCLRLRLV